MRTVTPAYQALLDADDPTLTKIWSITRRDGQVLRLTSHDADLVVDGNTYKSTNSFVLSGVTQSASKGSQSGELQVVLSDQPGGVSITDIHDGLYNSARIVISHLFWSNPSAGSMVLMSGQFGTIIMDRRRGRAKIELLGNLQKGMQGSGEKYSPECRADLYDTRCGVSPVGFTSSGVVDVVASNRQFTATITPNPGNYLFNLGRVTWTSGLNVGQTFDVLDQYGANATQDIILTAIATKQSISIGDTFSIVQGCDKRPITCRDKFSNMLRFRGEPHVPGNDALIDNEKVV